MATINLHSIGKLIGKVLGEEQRTLRILGFKHSYLLQTFMIYNSSICHALRSVYKERLKQKLAFNILD